MGIIDVKAKWNLIENNWCMNPTHNDKGRAFSFVNYEEIIDDVNKGIDYIILAYGTRVENHSKDFINIKEKAAGIDKIISFYKRSSKNVILKLLLIDADAPIIEDAKLLAQYIDSLSSNDKTNSINLIGVSKCGAMAFNIPKYFQKLTSFYKINIYTVATPFTGTKLASPTIFYPDVKKLISSKLGDNKLADLVYHAIISYYEGICSNSHMDYDIAMLGGIPYDKLQYYDDSLIKDMFSDANIDAISKISCYRNFVTGIDENTFGEAVKTMNFTGIGLCILNDLFFDKKSDGMVMTDAQRIVESKFVRYDLKSHILTSSHHDIASNNRVFSDLLHVVDDTIEEHNDKIKYKIRK